MKGFSKHFREMRFKRWLDSNASEALVEMGVGEGQVLLDFGCGPGTYTIPAAKLVGEGGRIYALDVDKGALDMMEKKAEEEGLKNVVRIDAGVEGEIPIDDETIDVVLLIDVLQEIRDRGTLFGELHRILKPGGIVCIFPMHIGDEDATRLAESRGFIPKGKKIKGRMLLFSK